MLDQLTLLVDKSLVVAENTSGPTRYRLLETVRQYALEKLGESGEADAVRARHRDHYTSMAARLDAPARNDYEQRIEQAEIEIDNLRAAFAWSLENRDIEQALELASSLQPLWFCRGRIVKGWRGSTPRFTADDRAPPRGGGRGARPGARRQGRARFVDSGGATASMDRCSSRPWPSHATSTIRPC